MSAAPLPSPTPWRVSERTRSNPGQERLVRAANGRIVFKTFRPWDEPGHLELNDVNAAFAVRCVNSHDVLVDALTRSQVALSAVLEIAERQDQPADMLASLRSVVHRNDLALRDGNGLPATTRTDADVEDDKRAITEGADL